MNRTLGMRSLWIMLIVCLLGWSYVLYVRPRSTSSHQPDTSISIRVNPPQKSTSEADKIKGLIKSLAEIDQPDYGFSENDFASACRPLPGREEADIMGGYERKRSDALVELVKLGPRALPFLLDSLDDSTPTRITVKHEGDFGDMSFGCEMWGNPANQPEATALKELFKNAPYSSGLDANAVHSYTVKVGDICFVIIGQIVGRRYQAVRNQPTGCIVINSPTRYPAIAKAIRAAWSAPDSDKRLLESLLSDYNTKPRPFNSEEFSRKWDSADHLQISAAMRLLYYYTKQIAPKIGKRLEGFQVHWVGPSEWIGGTEKQLDAYMNRDQANGVRTADFIRAVAWCQEPEIQSALAGIFRRTGDQDILVASVRGMGAGDEPLVRRRIGQFLTGLPTDDVHSTGHPASDLLLALGHYGGEAARPLFENYLKIKSAQRIDTMADVLRKVRREWAVDLLTPFLRDKRTLDWDYEVTPGQNEPRLPVRVCDAVAKTLAETQQGLTFKKEGSHENLDRQIDQMLLQLSSGRPH